MTNTYSNKHGLASTTQSYVHVPLHTHTLARAESSTRRAGLECRLWQQLALAKLA